MKILSAYDCGAYNFLFGSVVTKRHASTEGCVVEAWFGSSVQKTCASGIVRVGAVLPLGMRRFIRNN